MSLQMVLLAAVVSTGGLAELRATPQEPLGLAGEQHRCQRVAQAKSDYKTVPGGLPGRSESSEEANPSKPQRAPASERAATKKSTKGKEKDGKKGIQGIQ
jgi:hypothetical protein